MKDLIKKILKEEFDDFEWVQDVPEHFSNEIYQLLEDSVEIYQRGINSNMPELDLGDNIKFIRMTFPDGYSDTIGLTFGDDEFRLKQVLRIVYDVFPNVDKKTAIETTKAFMDNEIYMNK